MILYETVISQVTYYVYIGTIMYSKYPNKYT